MAAATASYYPGQEYLAGKYCHVKPASPKNLEERLRIPPGFPSVLRSTLAWTRAEIEQSVDDCIIQLSPDDLITLDTAARDFKEHHTSLQDISTDSFILPKELADRLRKVSENCYNGRGFTVVKGLDPSRYSTYENVIMYSGISAYIAPQHGFLDKARSTVVSHIVNAAVTSSDSKIKSSPGLTDSPLAFHTDNCEILALYAVNVASEGGQTFVSSAYQLFNELATNRPDILQTLSDQWVLDTFRDYSQYPPITRPMMHVANGDKVTFTYSRLPMTGFNLKQRNPSLPALTPAQIEAMDTIQYMMTKNSFPLPWGKGDIVYINDMALMHARSAFKENSTNIQRHLVKFYLRDPAQNWPVSQSAEKNWNIIYGPNNPQGGRDEVWLSETGEVWGANDGDPDPDAPPEKPRPKPDPLSNG